MEPIRKLENIFIEVLMIDRNDVPSASTATQAAWDSIGKLNLVAGIEDAFSIELEAEDIMNFNSYVQGLEILKKYGITL